MMVGHPGPATYDILISRRYLPLGFLTAANVFPDFRQNVAEQLLNNDIVLVKVLDIAVK